MMFFSVAGGVRGTPVALQIVPGANPRRRIPHRRHRLYCSHRPGRRSHSRHAHRSRCSHRSSPRREVLHRPRRSRRRPSRLQRPGRRCCLPPWRPGRGRCRRRSSRPRPRPPPPAREQRDEGEAKKRAQATGSSSSSARAGRSISAVAPVAARYPVERLQQLGNARHHISGLCCYIPGRWVRRGLDGRPPRTSSPRAAICSKGDRAAQAATRPTRWCRGAGTRSSCRSATTSWPPSRTKRARGVEV